MKDDLMKMRARKKYLRRDPKNHKSRSFSCFWEKIKWVTWTSPSPVSAQQPSNKQILLKRSGSGQNQLTKKAIDWFVILNLPVFAIYDLLSNGDSTL